MRPPDGTRTGRASRWKRCSPSRSCCATARVGVGRGAAARTRVRASGGWGGRGGGGVIAEMGGEPVGAAWYRLFTEDTPGYGFVDEKTPELSIAVVPLHRRKGIGETVLGACMVQAREEGYQALSLSVAVHNRSRMMYQRAGFEKVSESGDGGDHWTMVANL